MKRKMFEKLIEWKHAKKRKVFLLLGARQTGKTYIVREFAKSNYRGFIEINFLEDAENGQFLAGASGAQDLISRLTLVLGRTIEPGSLVFFDEVQHIGKEAVTLSKFMLEDDRFDLVLSGSLLGTVLEGVTSFPVGYARVERMYPLDFEEFCWALDVPASIFEMVRDRYDNKKPLEETLHKQLVKLFRHYIVVGGMPEATKEFLGKGRDLGAARQVDLDIIEQYRYDITKYANARKTQILTIFDNVPAQLAKENKRFAMMTVKKGVSFDRLKDDFSWLVRAGIVLPACIVKEPKYPLLRTKDARKFKLYASDCGMLLSQFPNTAAMGVIEGAGDANYGAVYENVVAQELTAAGIPLYYYHSNRKGELDFLLETKEGEVLPVEVKSGKDYKLHTALNNLLGTEAYGIKQAVVLSEHNVSIGEREGKPVYYLPLYMLMCLTAQQDDNLRGMKLEEVSFESWT